MQKTFVNLIKRSKKKWYNYFFNQTRFSVQSNYYQCILYLNLRTLSLSLQFKFPLSILSLYLSVYNSLSMYASPRTHFTNELPLHGVTLNYCEILRCQDHLSNVTSSICISFCQCLSFLVSLFLSLSTGGYDSG